jgi:hypothetical protein
MRIAKARALLDELSDDPGEAEATALAYAVFDCSDSQRFQRYLAEADIIRDNLRALGYELIRVELTEP